MLRNLNIGLADLAYVIAASLIGCVLVGSGVIVFGGHIVSLMTAELQPRIFAAVAALAIIAMAWRATVFVGPRRASMAELAWTPRRAQGHTSLWISVALVAGIAGILSGLLASITHGLGMSPAEIIAWVVLAMSGSTAAFQMTDTVQREGQNGVPRWRLLRAHANVRSMHSSYVSLDGASLTLLHDQNTQPTRRPLLPTPRATAASLAKTVAIRIASDQWRYAAAIVACATVASLTLGSVLGQLVAAAGSLSLTLISQRTWSTWRSSAVIRRSLAVAQGPTDIAMLAGTCTVPVLVAAAAMFVAGGLDALSGFATLTIAVVYVVVERTRALAALERSGPLGAMMQLPDLGPVPLGLFTKVLSGWATASLCCYLVIAHSSLAPVAILSTLLTVSVLRQRIA